MRAGEWDAKIQISSLARHYDAFLRRLAPGAGEFAWQAGVAVMQASLAGHVCLPLFSADAKGGSSLAGFYSDFCPDLPLPADGQWLDKLLGSGIFATGKETNVPFVVDLQHGRLYTQRYWQYEQRLAGELKRRAAGVLPISAEKISKALGAAFGILQPTELDGQRLAAGLSALKRLTVISGGPGTGKTYTVARIMALLQILNEPQRLKIALVAPTGKAAGRLQESIKKACESLSLSPEIMSSVSNVKASTIHRLLGWRPNSTEFRYNRHQQLALDLLIIDEASMVDLPLMTKLIEAMPFGGRIVLLGDRNQLASVESGRVMADICHNPENKFSGEMSRRLTACGVGKVASGDYSAEKNSLVDSVVLLIRSYRFLPGSAIGNLASAVLAGDRQLSEKAFAQDTGVVSYPFICDAKGRVGQEFIDLVVESYKGLVASVTPKQAFTAMRRLQVLCVHRSGYGGIGYMNRQIEQILGQAAMIENKGLWYRGRPVIVSGNHYHLQLFNGDVGVCLLEEGDLRVFFPKVDGGVRSISPARMPPHETSYAITVHKSQGSEFEHVVLVLPERASPLLGRELLYTAVTRAKKKITMWGSKEVWAAGLQLVNQRQTGLADFLYG